MSTSRPSRFDATLPNGARVPTDADVPNGARVPTDADVPDGARVPTGRRPGWRRRRGSRPRRRQVEAVDVERWQREVDSGRRPRPSLVLLDLEPHVALWRTGQAEVDAGVARLAGRWADQPVLVVTNSARVVSGRVLPPTWRQRTLARKPFTRLQAPTGSVVVGDQPLQDGLLAWRVQATFVRVPLPATAPWWARTTHRLFSPLSRLWLRPGRRPVPAAAPAPRTRRRPGRACPGGSGRGGRPG